LSLDKKADAVDEVNTRLTKESIPAVAKDKIAARLQKAVKDLQRSKHVLAMFMCYD
jgi:hypothetical protein